MDIQQNDQELSKTACGGKLKDPSKYPSAEFQGKTIYFCTHACLRAFKDNPDAFVAGEVEHPSNEEQPNAASYAKK